MPSTYKRFLALRKRLFKMISDYFDDGGDACKSYEGTFEIVYSYPDYFDDEDAEASVPDAVLINLHVYVVGPHRHYTFRGMTLDEALDRLEAALDEWDGANE